MEAETSVKPAAKSRFGRFELDPHHGAPRADGRDVPLRPKAFALLSYLAAHPGRLIAKAELMGAVWPGVVVTDDSLIQCISELRTALGDPSLIQTVARRGYRFAADTVGTASDTPPTASVVPQPALPALQTIPTPPRRVGLAVGVAALAALVLPAAGWQWWRGRTPRLNLDAAFAARRAVAILPFTDTAATPSPGFADAVTEDVSIAVARLPDVMLFAGSSTAAVADAMDAAKRLRASHVLSGSVERHADEVVIRARLLETRSNATLWNERFEYAGDAPRTWQRDISQRIAQSLDVRLREPPRDAGAGRLDAVGATQQGMHLVIHATNRADILKARALLEQALAADPDSVVALTFWAFTHTQEVMRRWSTDPDRQVASASVALDHALGLRRDYWPVHFHRSFVLYLQGRIDDAALACEAVLALWPNEPHALQRLAFYRLQQGRPEEVAAPVMLALRLNPLEPTQVAAGHFYLGMALFHMHRDDAAYAEMQQALAANPSFGFARQWMAAIDALHGRYAQAHEHLAAFEASVPGQSIARLKASEPSRNVAYWAERERFYVGLRQAGLAPG